MIRLQAFGGLDLDLGHVGGAPPTLRPRVLALLALLIGTGARAVSRDKVLAYLWPDSDTDHARNSLKQALFTLRHCLGPAVVQPCCGGLRLDRALVWSDVWEFEKATCAGWLERAAEVYRGPFLDGVHVSGLAEFERWVEDERQRLDQRFGLVLQRLASCARAEGRLLDAVEWSRRLAWRDPLSSAEALQLMRSLVAIGDPTGALEHLRTHARRVGAELGGPPAAELVQLAEEIRRRLSTAGAGQGLWSGSSQAVSAGVARTRRVRKAQPSA